VSGAGDGRQQPSTSRWRAAGAADRYRGPSYDAYNDNASHRHPGQQQQQQQQPPPQLWYPATTNEPGSPSTSMSSSSTSAAADSAGSRRALNEHDQPQTALRGADNNNNNDDDDDDVRVFVAFTFILELVIVVGLALLEYFLRSRVISF